MPNPEDITDPTTAMNMALVLMAKAFKLNYSTPTNNNQRISSNPENKQIAQPGMNMGQDRQMQMVRDLDEIEEVNANCILMANLQQASTSVTQTDSAPVYDTDGSTETKDLHTTNYTQLYDFLKYNQKEVDELKAERIAMIQDPLALMANSNNPYASLAPRQDLSPFNQNFMQPPMQNPEDITDPTTAMNMALALMAKAFKLNYSTPTNNNQRISSNPKNMQIAQPGHFARDCTVRPRRRDAAYLQTQLLITQKEEAGIQLQAEEYDLMAAAADLDEIEEVNANCILMANLQQASSSGTQTDSTPVYDLDGSAEVIQICLWCVDSGYSKHMTRNLKLLINFVWKFMGTVRFENDHVAANRVLVIFSGEIF
nr:Gag-Pol polyprotein [Tanacetum cinerariifolium]